MDYLRRALPGSEALRRAEGLLEQLQTQASLDHTDGQSTFFFFFVVLRTEAGPPTGNLNWL